MGAVLLLLGAIPGLPLALSDGSCSVAERAWFQLGVSIQYRAEIHVPHWFAPAGALMIAVALLGYVAH